MSRERNNEDKERKCGKKKIFSSVTNVKISANNEWNASTIVARMVTEEHSANRLTFLPTKIS